MLENVYIIHEEIVIKINDNMMVDWKLVINKHVPLFDTVEVFKTDRQSIMKKIKIIHRLHTMFNDSSSSK